MKTLSKVMIFILLVMLSQEGCIRYCTKEYRYNKILTFGYVNLKIDSVNRRVVRIYKIDKNNNIIDESEIVFDTTRCSMFKGSLFQWIARDSVICDGEFGYKFPDYVKFSLNLSLGEERVCPYNLVMEVDDVRRDSISDIVFVIGDPQCHPENASAVYFKFNGQSYYLPFNGGSGFTLEIK